MFGGVVGPLLALTGARAGGVRIVSPQRESNPRPVAAAQAIIFAHPGIEPSPLCIIQVHIIPVHKCAVKSQLRVSQSLAELHVGVWKRRFASWVRARMDAIGDSCRLHVSQLYLDL